MEKLILGHFLQVLDNGSGGFTIDSRPNHGMHLDKDGKIVSIKPKAECVQGSETLDYGEKFILPGFIDTHVHFPQLDMIGVYSGELLEWLDEHTFPHETKLIQDPEAAKTAADNFLEELFKNGTSTAVVFASSKKGPTETLFKSFDKAGARLISGKISMNRFAPEAMLDQIDDDLNDSKDLIDRWHGKDDRIYYALSPRFAPSCSSEMMHGLSDLKQADDSLYIQTHFAENLAEIAWVKELFQRRRII